MTAKQRLLEALEEVERIEELLDGFETTKDRNLLVQVSSSMRQLHPSLRELSVWADCKTSGLRKGSPKKEAAHDAFEEAMVVEVECFSRRDK